MIWNPIEFFLPKKFLGIDIGTSLIKIVEISRFGNRRRLENYGALSSSILYEKAFRTFEKNTLFLSSDDIARAIKAIMEEAKTKTKQTVFSIPDFSTFFTNFTLPPMTEDELPQAVQYAARQHVPMPLGEVTLDWQLIEGRASNQKKTNLRVLLVAVPNEVINQYRKIAQLSGLELVALEAEVFGLIRSLIEEDEKRTIALIDIGAQSTTCSIIEKRILQLSHSFDMSGNEFTKIVSKSLGIEYSKAEDYKKKYGLLSDQSPKIQEILLPLVDILLKEVEGIINNFEIRKEKEIQKVILAGGSAFLPVLKEYFAEVLKKEVEIANPFSNLFYSPILEKTLEKMGPGYAIAVGMALRGIEY